MCFLLTMVIFGLPPYTLLEGKILPVSSPGQATEPSPTRSAKSVITSLMRINAAWAEEEVEDAWGRHCPAVMRTRWIPSEKGLDMWVKRWLQIWLFLNSFILCAHSRHDCYRHGGMTAEKHGSDVTRPTCLYWSNHLIAPKHVDVSAKLFGSTIMHNIVLHKHHYCMQHQTIPNSWHGIAHWW